MPIYEYQCKACDELHEALQKVSDAPLVDCPACGKPELRKKVSAAAFRLKGSGWYETDFKAGNKKNLAGDASSEGGDKASGGGEKSDAKGSDGAAKSDGDKKSSPKDSKPAAGKTGGGDSAA